MESGADILMTVGLITCSEMFVMDDNAIHSIKLHRLVHQRQNYYEYSHFQLFTFPSNKKSPPSNNCRPNKTAIQTSPLNKNYISFACWLHKFIQWYTCIRAAPTTELTIFCHMNNECNSKIAEKFILFAEL